MELPGGAPPMQYDGGSSSGEEMGGSDCSDLAGFLEDLDLEEEGADEGASSLTVKSVSSLTSVFT